LAKAESGDDGNPVAGDANLVGDAATLASLRADLSAAQQARSTLESKVASLTKLKQQNTTQAQLLEARNKEIALLRRSLNDRNEEVSEGKKLVEQVQDEMISLNLQLNMAEEKADKLDLENKDLVKRWMKKMGEEADRMNDQSKW
jgi:chromosome segregation ATPase